MDDSAKLIIVIILAMVALPMVGMAVSEYHRYDCKVELAKAGRSVDDIKKVCK